MSDIQINQRKTYEKNECEYNFVEKYEELQRIASFIVSQHCFHNRLRKNGFFYHEDMKIVNNFVHIAILKSIKTGILFTENYATE